MLTSPRYGLWTVCVVAGLSDGVVWCGSVDGSGYSLGDGGYASEFAGAALWQVFGGVCFFGGAFNVGLVGGVVLAA